MKRLVFWLALLSGAVACNNGGKVEVNLNADSLKQSLDTSFRQAKDSVEAKGERTLNSVKEKVKDLNLKVSITDSSKTK